MIWRTLLLLCAAAAWGTVGAGGEGGEEGCPRDCSCFEGLEMQLWCNVTEATASIRQIELRLNIPKYAVVDCEQSDALLETLAADGKLIPFGAGAPTAIAAEDTQPTAEPVLPPLPAVPALRNVSLDMMSFEYCPAPADGGSGWGGAVRALGVSGARRLFLRGAPLRALQPALLASLPELRQLVVRAPGEAAQPWTPRAELLQALPRLTSLLVSDTRVRLEPRAFLGEGAPWPLEVLDLSGGWVEDLSEGAFSGLSHLRRLSLWRSNVSAVPAGALAGLEALEVLDLSGNRLRSLDGAALGGAGPGGLGALRDLHVLGSELRSLSGLSELARLEVVAVTDCAGAALRTNAGLLAGLARLRGVQLERCGLAAVDADWLLGATALQNLSLAGNALRELPPALLRAQANLERLDLSHNELQALSPDLFLNLHKLSELNLERNRLSELPAYPGKGAFAGAPLRWLRLSHNALRLAAPRTVADAGGGGGGGGGEEWLSLSPLRDLAQLRRLELAHNNISEVFSDWVLSLQLRFLDLSYNQINYLSDGDLDFLSNEIVVDLRHNQITTVSLTELRPHVTAVPESERGAGGGVRVRLDHNPYTCDCRLHTFVRRLRGEGGEGGEGADAPRVQLLGAAAAACAAPRALAAQTLASVPLAALRCALPAPACPASCRCELRPEGRALEMRCAAPPPPGAAPRPAAYGLRGVELRLLEAPPPALPLRLPDDVRLLNLSGLGLRAVPQLAAASLAALRLLDLSNNALQTVPAALLALSAPPAPPAANTSAGAASRLRLRLAGNPFRCDCSHITEFDLLLKHRGNVDDFASIECVSESGSMVSLGAGGGVGAARCGARGALLAAAAALLLAGCLLALLYCRFERQLKVLLYARGCCARWLEEEEDGEGEAGARYDAFVSYSHRDSEWVLRELAPRLEAGGGGRRPLRLCLHQRDWVPGEWIPAQIVRSVAQSRRTLLVLSEHFLTSVWAREEWHAAHVRALRERRPRVLVVRLGEVPAAALPADLRAYLATNTYLQWGDPRFWDKLRYALPRVPRAPPAAAPALATAAAPALATAAAPALATATTPEGQLYNAATQKAVY